MYEFVPHAINLGVEGAELDVVFFFALADFGSKSDDIRKCLVCIPRRASLCALGTNLQFVTEGKTIE